MVKRLKNKKVFVGISGGVDSAVAALLLKKEGYEVVGVFIRTWTPDFINCTWKNERREAMRVCANLDIPFLECDAEKEYKEGVVNYMIEEYRKGRTPNPDVMCNKEVKFGVFWRFAQKRGADFIATGHYVKRCINKNFYILKKNLDKGKDQVYFLWTLNQADLAHTLFPLGNFRKNNIRKLANKYKLPNAKKKDSQGVCFLGPLDMKNFLGHYIDVKKGNVLNEKKEIIGSHKGSFLFTIGERHGFDIDKKYKRSKPLYVVAKNISDNTIIVSEKSPILTRKEGSATSVSVRNINWISLKPKEEKKYQAQIRYHGELMNCYIKNKGNDCVSVIFKDEILVDAGQSMVFYDEDVCMGGGVID